jgi:Ca2+-binding EF-hand superfamily protein
LISLDSIRKCYINLSDIKILQKYFHEIFIDLSDYNLEHQKNLLSLVTFYDYMKLPIFISEKLFNSFDKDNDNFLSENEFVFNLSKLYLGNFKETCEIIFNLLDFNKDGIINNDDVKILLSYLPLKIEDNNLIDIIQKTSLKEIDEIISNTFDKYNGKIKYKDFNSVI